MFHTFMNERLTKCIRKCIVSVLIIDLFIWGPCVIISLMVSKSFYYFHFNEMVYDSRLFLTDKIVIASISFMELYVIELNSVRFSDANELLGFLKFIKKNNRKYTFNQHYAIITFRKFICFYASSRVRMYEYFFSSLT